MTRPASRHASPSSSRAGSAADGFLNVLAAAVREALSTQGFTSRLRPADVPQQRFAREARSCGDGRVPRFRLRDFDHRQPMCSRRRNIAERITIGTRQRTSPEEDARYRRFAELAGRGRQRSGGLAGAVPMTALVGLEPRDVRMHDELETFVAPLREPEAIAAFE